MIGLYVVQKMKSYEHRINRGSVKITDSSDALRPANEEKSKQENTKGRKLMTLDSGFPHKVLITLIIVTSIALKLSFHGKKENEQNLLGETLQWILVFTIFVTCLISVIGALKYRRFKLWGDSIRSSEDPTTFWMYIFFWSALALITLPLSIFLITN